MVKTLLSGALTQVIQVMTTEFSTARDMDGHRSHTLSTAAGNFVSDVSGRLVIKYAGRAKTQELRAVMKT